MYVYAYRIHAQHNNTHRQENMLNVVHAQDTGWPRLIGCLKLQVIFRKKATNNRALLRKITCKDEASYASSPPCNTCTTSCMLNRKPAQHTETMDTRCVYMPA